MAGIDDVTPFVGADRAANPQGQNVMSEWGTALQDPSVRSALIQFGISMMTPPSSGQSSLGHLGRAIGSVGEMYTRQDEETLKRDKVDADLVLRERTLDQGERRTRASEQNADTRRKALDQRASGGNLSAKDIVKMQLQNDRQLKQRAKELAREYHKDANSTFPEPTPDALRFKGKSVAEIERELLNDPNFVKQQKEQSQKLIESTIPPANQRVVGRAYQTPRGPLVWQGGGWALPTPTGPGPADVEDDDE